MNRWAYQNYHQPQKGLVGFGCVAEFRRGESCGRNSSSMVNSNGVVCPKPRRLVNFHDPIFIASSRLLHNNNQQMEACESETGTELLDIILTKADYGAEKSNFQAACSPPFYSGSPPVRVSNPVIQDERFGNGKPSPLSPSFEPPMIGSPSSCKNMNAGGCILVKYGHNPPPVRVVGFNSRFSAVA